MSTGSKGVRTILRSGTPAKKVPVVRNVHFRCLTTTSSHAPQYNFYIGSRTYSTTRTWHKSVQENDVVDELSSDFDVALEDELLAIQDASIAELESRLGKSLQQAVEQDQFGADIEALQEDTQDDVLEEELEDDPSELVILQLRGQGASNEEIAGEARRLFGDYLRADTLTEDELVLYKRMYGNPSPHPDEEEYEEEEEEETEHEQVPDNVLLDQAGSEVAYQLEDAGQIAAAMEKRGMMGTSSSQEEPQEMLPYTPSPTEVARAAEVASLLEGEVYDEDNYDFDEEDQDTRSHPLTTLGRFATYPRTTFMPKETFVQPLETVLSDYSNKHLKEACERVFGGPGLPDSPLTPRLAKVRQQLPIPLEASQLSMGQMEANAFVSAVMPPTYASISASLVEVRKRLGSSWLNKLLAKPGGPRVLDAGSGGVGIVAWREILQAHWDTLHTSDKGTPPKVPETKSVVLTGSDNLRHRATKLVENTTFVPRLPDVASTRQAPTLDDDRPAQQRKQFDVIIASHSLFPLREEWERKQHVQNLWSLLSDDGGVLIIVEKGIPRGFEVVAGARELILENYLEIPEGHETHYSVDPQEQPLKGPIYTKSPGMIVAPCTNHDRCPLYRTSGVSRGRKDICSFQQRYIRPPFLQRILGAKDRNHDDVDFSYVSFMKGEDLRTRTFSTWEQVNDPMSAPSASSANAPTVAQSQQKTASRIQQGFEHYDPAWSDSSTPPPTHTLPRILSHPLKRKGHITFDLCTPQAEIRRWTIPKSFSRQAYRDARKARWGDLWALGAKTNIPRNLKVGTPAKDIDKGEGMKSSSVKPRSRKERLEMKIAKVLEADQEMQDEDDEEEDEFERMVEEANLLDEDDEDELIDMDTLVPKKAKSNVMNKPAQTHAKLDGVNLFPQKSAGTRSAAASDGSRTVRRVPSGDSKGSESMVAEQPPDYNANRYGYTEKDALSDWTAELDGAMLGDEARRVLAKEGRRATSKNTFRKKRDIRRVKRQQGSAQL